MNTSGPEALGVPQVRTHYILTVPSSSQGKEGINDRYVVSVQPVRLRDRRSWEVAAEFPQSFQTCERSARATELVGNAVDMLREPARFSHSRRTPNSVPAGADGEAESPFGRIGRSARRLRLKEVGSLELDARRRNRGPQATKEQTIGRGTLPPSIEAERLRDELEAERSKGFWLVCRL